MVTFQTTIKVPVIAANGIKQYLFSSKELRAGIRKYTYYNSISVINGSELDVRLEIDGNKTFPIPEGGSFQRSGLQYESFNIVNNNDLYTIGEGLIEIVCSVEGV